MYAASVQRLFHTLLICFLAGVGLLVTGCDSGGSNGDDRNYEWTGKWQAISASEFDLSQGDIYYDITSEEVTSILQFDQSGCRSETAEITDIDGNTITTETEDGETSQVMVEVQDNGNLLIERVGDNVGTATARPADSVPSCN